MVVGLTNDECCLLYNLHVEKRHVLERIEKIF